MSGRIFKKETNKFSLMKLKESKFRRYDLWKGEKGANKYNQINFHKFDRLASFDYSYFNENNNVHWKKERRRRKIRCTTTKMPKEPVNDHQPTKDKQRANWNSSMMHQLDAWTKDSIKEIYDKPTPRNLKRTFLLML